LILRLSRSSQRDPGLILILSSTFGFVNHKGESMNLNPFTYLSRAVEAALWQGTQNFLRKINLQIDAADLPEEEPPLLIELQMPDEQTQPVAEETTPKRNKGKK